MDWLDVKLMRTYAPDDNGHGHRSPTSMGRADQDHEMTISQMAEAFDVTMRTLRFYEQKGLLQPRRVGKRRLYNEASRERLRLVLKGKAMGFGLDEIVDLVDAVESNADDAARTKAVREICENQRNILEARRKTIDAQIEQTTLAINGKLPL